MDMAIASFHHTRTELQNIEDNLARAVWSAAAVSLEHAVKTHPARCRSLRPEICRTTTIGDGNNKLFEAVCPVIPETNPRYLHVAADAEPVPLPCGRYPTKGCACREHEAQAPPSPENRRKRVMPRDIGKRERIYCNNNRDAPAPGDVKSYISAGVISFAYPCGHISAIQPMFWHESHLQVFALLRELAEKAPDITRVGCDDTCHFHLWIVARFATSTDATALRLATVADFFVDVFHFKKGHKDPTCRSRYNPEDRSYLAAIATSAAESQWHWLNRYGPIVRHMPAPHACLLLQHRMLLRNSSPLTI